MLQQQQQQHLLLIRIYLKTSLTIALVILHVATTATTTFIVDSDLTRAKDH